MQHYVHDKRKYMDTWQTQSTVRDMQISEIKKTCYHVLKCTKIYTSGIESNEKYFSVMPNLQTNYCLESDFQSVDPHTGSKCSIHDTKRHKDNQMQGLELSCIIP